MEKWKGVEKMREILFRAKDTEGVWKCGDYIACNEEYCNIKERTLLRTNNLCKVKTVGQYTGLTDKNGYKIFEGDICEVTLFNCYGADRQEIVEVINKYGCFWFKSESILIVFDAVGNFESDVEVIGNIYDNPELLKRSK